MKADDIYKVIQQMQADIALIRASIAGDALGNAGLADRIKILEQNQLKMNNRIAEVDTARRKLTAYIIGGATTASATASGLLNLIM